MLQRGYPQFGRSDNSQLEFFSLFQCLHGLPCPWEAQKCHESQPIKSNKELKNRSKIAYSKKTVPLEKGRLKALFDRSDELTWTGWSCHFQKYQVCWNWPKKSIKRTQIRLPSIMYTDSFKNLYRFFKFYFCNQTSLLRQNFWCIALSHSSTGLGSTNDLSWKSENWKPKCPDLFWSQCTVTVRSLEVAETTASGRSDVA